MEYEYSKDADDNELLICTSCELGYYKSNGGCCQMNEYWDGSECLSDLIAVVGYPCKYYQNDLKCVFEGDM